MEWMCILLPACVTMIIFERRDEKKKSVSLKMELLNYGTLVLCINFLTLCVIDYILGVKATVETLTSFGFATKYILISLFFAVAIPYILETIKKYIELKLSVKKQE